MGDVIIEAVDAAEAGPDFGLPAKLGGIVWIAVTPGKALHCRLPAGPA